MNFIINNLERQADTGLVTVVHWSAIKEDGEFSASVYQAMPVEAGDDFVPFADLTQETVIGWVKAKLDLESVEAALDAQIDAQKAPKVLAGLPWASEE